MGRPSDYTLELAAEFCSRIAAGESVRSVCKADDMPCDKTIFLWLQRHKDFLQHYELAVASRTDVHIEDMLDIADDSSRDFTETENGKVYNAEHVQRSRLRVDTRKWIASKLKPKKYGDKLELGGAVEHVHTTADAIEAARLRAIQGAKTQAE